MIGFLNSHAMTEFKSTKFQPPSSALFENCDFPHIYHKYSCEVCCNDNIWGRVKALMKHVAKFITQLLLSSLMK